MANVRGFGAAGDGQTDDTDAIRHALADGEGVLEFSPGVYRITQTIEVDLTKPRYFGISGTLGATRIVMDGPGPAFRLVGSHQGTANPRTFLPTVWSNERFPCIRGLEILGNHEQADGIELIRTMQATIQETMIRNVGVAIRLTERNRNFLLNACHLYDNRQVGVLFDNCNMHQAIIAANHISYNKVAGIQSIGGDLHNLQITGNDIEYNYDPMTEGAADVWFDAREGIASEITIASNTIQAVPATKGTNVRILGQVGAVPATARLITIVGNVLGSQETNIEMSFADRVTVTGNTIYDGTRISIAAADSQHVVIGNNSLAWSAPTDGRMNGGVQMVRCTASILNGLVFDGSQHGNNDSGACIELIGCRDTAVTGCQILRPATRGIWLDGCEYCKVSDNSVLDHEAEPTMVTAIRANGKSNLVQNNLVAGKGKRLLDFPDAPEMAQRNVVM